MKKHKHELVRIGGPAYRKSEKCEVCKRSFKKVEFGHHFKTGHGSIDVCLMCTDTLYQTIFADLAGSMFFLKAEIEDIRRFLNSLAKSRKWREIVREARLPKKSKSKLIRK